ncbi:MAG: ABC transporter permease subunit, partial [Candidatus Eisenbacteria bacterium]|nr:ABC transporter permease subunit [Candidatus Eisenbacteria bacterium]
MRRTSLGEQLGRTFVTIASALMLTLLLLPLLGLALQIAPSQLLARLTDPLVLSALRLSLITSLAATVVVVLLGLPLAYLLATRRLPARRLIEVLVELPLVLPPTVAGFALLLALGRRGLAGEALSVLGIQLPFTTLGVVVAQSFMAAPLFITTARAGFESVDPRLVEVAST